MGFFVQDNTTLETVWFSVLAAISLLCFPCGIRLARRFPQIVAAKLLPLLCLLLAYENVVLALSNVLANDFILVLIGRSTRAAVIPLFLVVMFEVAYAVHKRRSVKFCGIVFDQGHRRSVEPCSWFLRNFVGIVAVMIFVVGILVNYDTIVGNDEKAGGTGLVDTEDASAHLLLALLPTSGMALIALYIAVYMWKYGNDASIVVQSTVCNGWIFLFLGTLALLAGQVPPEWCFRVVNESGQVLFLLSMIAIGREIGKEVQAADDFSSFLQKENELETNSPNMLPTITPALHDTGRPKVPVLALAVNANGGMGVEAAALDKRAAARLSGKGGDTEIAAGVGGGAGVPRRGVGEVAEASTQDEENGLREHRNIEDVTRPMDKQGGRPISGGNSRALSGIFKKRGAPLLANREDRYFAGLSEDEKQDACDTRGSGGVVMESATGGGAGGGVGGGGGGDAELSSRAEAGAVNASGASVKGSSGAGGKPSGAASSSIRGADQTAAGEKNDAGLVGLGFRRKRIDEV